MNVADSLERAARHFFHDPALILAGSPIAYGAVRDEVARVAAGLRAAGIEPGDRVALLLPNTLSFAVAYFASQWVGAVAVSVNVMLTTDEVRYLLQDSGARLVFTTQALWAALEPLADPLLGGRDRVVLCEGDIPGTVPLAELGAGLRTSAPVSREASAPAAILYTSGTTGKQKGATLSVGNLVFNAHTTRLYLRMDPSDRLLLFLPLFHVFGQNFILNAAVAAGATLVLHPRFDPETVLNSIERDGVTMFFGVPTVFIALLNAGVPPERLASVRYFFSAAATMPGEVSSGDERQESLGRKMSGVLFCPGAASRLHPQLSARGGVTEALAPALGSMLLLRGRTRRAQSQLRALVGPDRRRAGPRPRHRPRRAARRPGRPAGRRRVRGVGA